MFEYGIPLLHLGLQARFWKVLDLYCLLLDQIEGI
jgi:hypothetical protein